MASRLELSARLHEFADNVYFQPPENLRMSYPAIVYHPDEEVRKFADNSTYGLTDRYQLTIIDEDPDSVIRKAVRTGFQLISFDRWFATENLNHWIYSLHY